VQGRRGICGEGSLSQMSRPRRGRRNRKSRVPSESPENVVEAIQDMELRMHALRDGVRSAAWLIWQTRKFLISAGAVDLKIPEAEVTPPYLRVAFEFLRISTKHQAKWAVEVSRAREDEVPVRVYRLRWLDWAHYRRWRTGCPIPELVRSRSHIAPGGPLNT
jgi:hypothetical protein